MERAIVAALGDEGVEAPGAHAEGPDYTGVWAGERKIASIGVHVARGVTTHGFAVNVDNDLAAVRMDRALRAGGRAHDLAAARDRGRASCCPASAGAWRSPSPQAHGLRQRLVSERRLLAALGEPVAA